MKFLQTAFSLLVLGVAPATYAKDSVTIDINGAVQSYTDAVRLSTVLQQLDNPQTVYWPDAALFIEDKALLTQKHQLMAVLMARLSELSAHSSEKQQLADFIAWMSGLNVARRLNLPIEYERARHVKKSNPLLTPGRYFLSARPASPNITLTGAVVNHQVSIDAAQTLQTRDLYQHYATDNADNSWLYWSVDAKQWHKNGIAYWNATPVSLASGSLVYIPFASSVLGSDSDELNQQILSLLGNWVR